MVFLAAIQRHYRVDHLDPWVIHFSGDFGIRWYGLAYLAGFLLGGLILTRWARKGRLPIPPEEVPTFIGYAMAGVIIGGRLGYCFLYEPHFVFDHPLEIFEMWHGGMASHGGIAGLILAHIACHKTWQRGLIAYSYNARTSEAKMAIDVPMRCT